MAINCGDNEEEDDGQGGGILIKWEIFTGKMAVSRDNDESNYDEEDDYEGNDGGDKDCKGGSNILNFLPSPFSRIQVLS